MTDERKGFLTWLLIITVIGSALRGYHLIDIPYTFDELSALNRTHYHSFHQLINEGVAPDGHPAGVQIFLYFWTKLFGYSEWVVKLPFIAMGILCIPLIYIIGARWFNRDAAIIAACLVAGLQYTVMYSQIARPYISGLFLVLLLVVIWNKVMEKITFRNFMAYSIVLALCAYNHYFSLLTAASIALTGFFVIERKELLKYTLSLLLAAAFFVPHIPLFFEQLKLKGLEWVTVPDPSFFTNYLYYIFNFSTCIIAAVALLILQGIYFSIKKDESVRFKPRIIALLWFMVPAAVGYFYSVYRAPVLQNSVLIFGFPFLVLFICSFIRLPGSWLRSVEITALLVILCVSLVWGRNYYSIFYHQETEMFAKHISGFEKAYGQKSVAAVVNTNSNYLDFYKAKYKTGWTYQTFDAIGDNIAWRKWLEKSDAQYLILCNPPVEWNAQYLAIAKEYYPYVDSAYYGFTTDIYILKKDSALCKPAVAPLFQLKIAEWDFPPPIKDENNVNIISDSMDVQLFRSPNNPLWLNEKAKLNISIDAYTDSVIPNGALSLQLVGNCKGKTGEILQTRESLLQSFTGSDMGWHTIYLTARLYHSPLSNPFNRSGYITVDLFERHSSCLKFRNFKIEVVPDNPVLYALIKK